jgi:hypothetical protein
MCVQAFVRACVRWSFRECNVIAYYYVLKRSCVQGFLLVIMSASNRVCVHMLLLTKECSCKRSHKRTCVPNCVRISFREFVLMFVNTSELASRRTFVQTYLLSHAQS